MKRIMSHLLILLTLSGCATTGTKRILTGAAMGASTGAVGGIVLSPNDESRGVNALVFGLAGALIGGAVGLLTDTKPESAASVDSLQKRETLDKSTREFLVTPTQDLPEFLRNRLQPLVIEEYVESDTVGEDGALHEPHKAYRIKRQGELFSKPGKTK